MSRAQGKIFCVIPSGACSPTSGPPGASVALPAPPSSEPTPAARLPGLNRLNSSVRRGTLRTKGAGLHRAILPVNGAIAISKQREGQLDDKRKTVEFSVRLEKSLACDLPSSSSSPSIYLPIKMAPLTGRTHTMQISLVCFLSEPLSRRNTLDSKEQEIGTPAQTLTTATPAGRPALPGVGEHAPDSITQNLPPAPSTTQVTRQYRTG